MPQGGAGMVADVGLVVVLGTLRRQQLLHLRADDLQYYFV